MKKNKENKLYVNNRQFYDEILISLENDVLTEGAVEMITRIAHRAVNNLSYKYPEDREDAIATAIMKCLMYWRSFKPELESKNPFSYFTQICRNGYTESFNKLRPLKSADVISISHENIDLF